MNLVFATHNQNKLTEVAKMFPSHIELLSLSQIDFNKDIPETELTLKGNAQLKVDAIRETGVLNCFSDDSGLFVNALNGEPGVFSARYSGKRHSDTNNDLLLQNMQNIKSRSAYYQSVFCLFFKGQHYFFEGRLNGKIAHETKGSNGFGYDPIFIPDGYTSTLGELSELIKLKLSHRTKALNKMIEFIALNG